MHPNKCCKHLMRYIIFFLKLTIIKSVEILSHENGYMHSHKKLTCKLSINFKSNLETLYTKQKT